MNTPIAHAALSSLRTALGGRYAFERELGRGGMATVFLAHDLERNRHVAVKVLLAEFAMTLATERFLREIAVATALRHPRIVSVLDSGQTAGVLYYVMPFVEGGSLRDRLNRESQLPIDEAIAITRQVADALAHAHAHGVIHRDIKPENILFGERGALVTDFGVARAVTAAGGETLTKTGMVVGTPSYMSPEQASGGRGVTPASDIYSLACVLYEMLAGQPPFTGPTPGVVVARHVLDTPPNLRIMRSGVTVALEDAIGVAMAKSAADRFRSVTEFAAGLTDHEGAARRRREKPNVPAAIEQAGRLPWWRRPVTHGGVTVALALAMAVSRLAGDHSCWLA
jgi:eukaryotic-like serine/threonine-protein kinase